MHETSTPLVLPATSEGSLADLPGRQARAVRSVDPHQRVADLGG